MPNRIIRASILDSERYHGVDIRARLAFFELLLCCDDYGLIPVNDLFLIRHTTAFLGVDRKVIAQVLESLADHDLIRLYTEKSGVMFAFIPRFRNNPRAKKPSWPIPPEEVGGNDIKELMQKVHSRCEAYAQHMRTSVAITETETETENRSSGLDVVGFDLPLSFSTVLPEDEKTASSSRRKNGVKKPKIEYDADGIQWRGITDEVAHVWELAYPAINIDQELAKAAAWVNSNPKNKTTQWGRFVTGWLSRAQNRATMNAMNNQGRNR